MSQRYGQGLADEILDELVNARHEFPPINSAHEGYAIILEEVQELWDEIRLKTGTKQGQRKEAIQVAAMCIRFMQDLGLDYENLSTR